MSRTRRQRATPKKARRLKPLTNKTKNFKGQLLNRQFQLAVYKLTSYFRRERLNGGPLLPVRQVGKRVSAALGIGINTVSKVKTVGDKGMPFLTPGKARKMIRKKRDIDDFTKCAIRNLIYEFHRKRLPMTVETLLKKIRERKIEISGGRETLRKVLHDIGFKYKKKNGTRFVMEQPRIVLLRLAFIRRFKKAHMEGKKSFSYLDETWVFRKGSGLSLAWQDDDIRSSAVRHVSQGGRYVVIHAGGRDGFVEGAGKVWSTDAKPKPGDDYHDNMNGALFRVWFTENYLPNLKKPTIIVMDNAPYHSCEDESEKLPNTNSNKKDIQKWLESHQVPYESGMFKKELLALVRLNKRAKSYIIDGLLAGTEHEMLRLPPYHACFNPIELVWGLVKRYFDTHVGRNQDYSEEMMLAIFKEALETVTPQVWDRICEKVEKKILDAYDAEIGSTDPLDNQFKMVINVGEDDDDDDDEWETVQSMEILGSDEDPDDPPPKDCQSKSCLTKAELACGISFQDVLSEKEYHRLENTNSHQGSKKISRSLFSNKSVPNTDNDFIPVSRSTSTLSPQADEIQMDYKDCGTPSKCSANMEEEATPIPHASDLSVPSANGIDFERTYIPPYIATAPPSEGHCHLSVDKSYSIAWSLIPERYISRQEIEDAVESVTCLITNHCVENEMAVERLQSPSDYDVNLCEPSVDLALELDETLNEHHTNLCESLDDPSPNEVVVQHLGSETGSVNEAMVTPPDLENLLQPKPFSPMDVDSYFKLIKEYCCSQGSDTFVYPSSFFKDKIVLKRELNPYSFNFRGFLHYDIVFIPVHMSAIWFFVVILPKKKIIRSYSTMTDDNEECLDEVVDFLNQEQQRETGTAINWGGWSVQSNSFPANHSIEDTPYLICCFARCIIEGLPCSFDVGNLQNSKLQMLQEINSGKLATLRLPPPQIETGEHHSIYKHKGNLLPDKCIEITLDEALDVFGVGQTYSPPKSYPEEMSVDFNDNVIENKTEISEEIIQLSDNEEEIAPPVLKGDGTLHIPLLDILRMPEDTILIRKFGLTLHVCDLLSLKDTNWLNDNIINFYLTLIREQVYFEHSTKVFNMCNNFYNQLTLSYDNVASWSKKVDLFNLDLLLIPINMNKAHWVLCVVDVKDRIISYLNSMGTPNNTVLNNILFYIETEYKKRFNDPFQKSLWKLQNVTGIAQQNNGFDCGVFVCWYARKLCYGEVIPKQVRSLRCMRLTMSEEICRGCLSPDISNNEDRKAIHQPRILLHSGVTIGWNETNMKVGVGCGLFNFNNTCYINSVLQVLFHCPPFAQWLLRCCMAECTSDKMCSNVTCALACTYKATIANGEIQPIRILYHLKTISSALVPLDWKGHDFRGLQQQDSHEFLRKILQQVDLEFISKCDGINLDIRSKETGPVPSIFGGYLRTDVECSSCGALSTSYDHFMDLSISMSVRLESSFVSFFSAEEVRDFPCSVCKVPGYCRKMALIEKPPLILCVHLKRFTNAGMKINRPVKCKPVIDLKPYIHEDSPYAAAPHKYRLISSLSHLGETCLSGHYFTTSQCSTGSFYKFDDLQVQPSTLHKCLTDQPYILIYEQMRNK